MSPAISRELLASVPLGEVRRVTFYKRDEITTDLICCDVVAGDRVWTFHEELAGWDLLLSHLDRLPDFRRDWFASVSQPAFAASETIAFARD